MNSALFIHQAITVLSWIVAAYFILSNTISIVLILISWHSIKQSKKILKNQKELTQHPGVTFIVPAHNEEITIVESVYSFLETKYQNIQVVVIDDGSSDHTSQNLINEFEMIPASIKRHSQLSPSKNHTIFKSTIYSNLLLVKRLNGGKAAAINLGLDYANTPYVCTVDADTIVEKDALTKAIRPFLLHKDSLLGVAGTLRIANGARLLHRGSVEGHLGGSNLVLFQVLEYIRAFYIGRIGWDHFDGTTLLSGAFSVFKREPLVEIGGFDPTSITEDLEVTIRLRNHFGNSRKGPRFKVIGEPVAWTQAPETLGDLRRQRIRWQRGLVSVLRNNWKLFLNPRYGVVGLFAIPYMVLFEWLGPFFEVAGYAVVLLGLYHQVILFDIFLSFFFGGLAYSILLTLLSIHVEESNYARHPNFKRDWTMFLFAAIFDNIGYRQLLSLLRLQAMIEILYKPARWGTHERKGILKKFTKKRYRKAS